MRTVVATRISSCPHHGLLLLPCLALAGCDLGGDSSYPQARFRHQTAPHYSHAPSVLGPGGIDVGGLAAENATIGTDNRLWRAALETVSFMPLVSADSTGGVIITDWYSAPNAPDKRQKVNVYILGRELRADSLRVSVFRQQRGDAGTWVDAPAADDAATAFGNAILTRAQQLSALDPPGLEIGDWPRRRLQT